MSTCCEYAYKRIIASTKNRIVRIFVLVCLSVNLTYAQQQPQVDQIIFPKEAMIKDSSGKSLKVITNKLTVKKIEDDLFYVTATIQAPENMDIVDIDIPITILEFNENVIDELKTKFHWLPNIKMGTDQVAGQHVFRSPCIIHVLQKKSIALIPDVKLLAANQVAPYYLDLQYRGNSILLHYGISSTSVAKHVYYQKSNIPFRLGKLIQLGFYLLVNENTDPLVMLKATNDFLWKNIASPYTRSMLPQTVSFEQYADTGYKMAFDHFWVDVNDTMGGITLSTFRRKDNTPRGRFFENDLWYQSWFNNMRTAYGLYSWGSMSGNAGLHEKALKMINLLLSAPNDKGWFKTIYAPLQNDWIASGGYKGKEVYYVPDNCWTAYWLLRFNTALKEIPGADDWLLSFGDALLKIQNEDGSFPARIKVSNLQSDSILDHTASSAMATWYLEELILAKKVPAANLQSYRNAIKRSLSFLITHVLPQQRFEDFESYFSCSPKPMNYYDTATALYNQNTLSMQWCASAFLKGHAIYKDKSYLDKGAYCLDILSLYQQIWNPPFISLYTFGGFGVQNTDGEWNDARQAQFAETYLDYYNATGNKQYLERAIYASRSAFALMVIPENSEVCPNNYRGSQFSGLWPGSMAENYAHYGVDGVSGQSGFHWGTGSALTTAAIFKKELGDIYIDGKQKIAIGVNGVIVNKVTWTKVPVLKVTQLPVFNGGRLSIRAKGLQSNLIIVNGKSVEVRN